MTILEKIEDKTAYPYITKFKKEPFVSFVLIKEKDISSFFFSEYDKVINLFKFFNKNLLNHKSLNLENIFWFLLLRKYLRINIDVKGEEIYNFIKRCELHQREQLGFRFSPDSNQKQPDIGSTYFALSSLKLLGLLEQYLSSLGQDQIKLAIKDFVLSLKKNGKFLHCIDKDCEICKRTTPARTLYSVMEIFTLLGIDNRKNKDGLRVFIGTRKRDPSIVFKLLCLKLIDLGYDVRDKEIQYLHQFQRSNGGFSFKKQIGRIDATFWIVYVLHNYSWLYDYNPVGIYSFINMKLNEILRTQDNLDTIKLMEISKLIMLLSIIWNKFIEEIERVIFIQLEKDQYIDLNQIQGAFGLHGAIEEIILYINLSYTFNLRILDNQKEFQNYANNLDQRFKILVTTIYEKLSEKSVISLTEIIKKFNVKFRDTPIKIKDVHLLIHEMMERKFFKGKIRIKKKFKKKYYFFLEFFPEKIIVSDTEIKTERLYYEKEKQKEFKNDIYNMSLKLKNVSLQIKEEINSYLLINEIDYAKQRLKFILRNALMEADFLNENIENSFNEELYYINIQAVLHSEIANWKESYSVLHQKLIEIDSYLKEKILEKEELRKNSNILKDLESKIFEIEKNTLKELDSFRNLFRKSLEGEFSYEKFDLLVKDLSKMSQKISKYDKIIYRVSQNLKIKEEKLNKKHRSVIKNWLRVKSNFDSDFNYYTDGFRFFNVNYNLIEDLYKNINDQIIIITESSQTKIKESKFQEASDSIKNDSDELLKLKTKEIQELKEIIKKEIKSKQKLYLLYHHLQEKLEHFEEDIIKNIAIHIQKLKNNVIEERNRAIIEDFDNYISDGIIEIRNVLFTCKKSLDQERNLRIKDITNGFTEIQNKFKEANKLYLKKLNKCKKLDVNFEESNVTVIQWEKFREYFNKEIEDLKNEYINNIINKKIITIANDKKTNHIKLKDLKTELNLSCKVLISRIKDMIEVSKINAELHEDNKCVLVYTEDYYKNKELRSFIDSLLFEKSREAIGKILALYDSSIRNKTLTVNTLELQNRINDFSHTGEFILVQFKNKIKEINIDQERKESVETKKIFETIMENDVLAISKIKNSLKLFNDVENFIASEYNNLRVELKRGFVKIFDNPEKINSYVEVEVLLDRKKKQIEQSIRQTQDNIEVKLKTILSQNSESSKLELEIRELNVKQKNNFLKEYEAKLEKLNGEITVLKSEEFRGKLMTLITNRKIYLSQLLGALERKVEDYLEIKEFIKAHVIVQKRAKVIESKIKTINKTINNHVKSFKKQSKDFETKNKYILDDFDKFIHEYQAILIEKVKALEQLILKEYVSMAIKGVHPEYLTISFLSSELKIKKQNIQNHLLFLISAEKLKGKYDPRLGVYCEDSEIFNNLDEKELQVVKNMNFKAYLFLNRLKNFTSQYYSIIAFFASSLTISYYLFTLTGGNPLAVIMPVSLVIILISYLFFKKRKEDKL